MSDDDKPDNIVELKPGKRPAGPGRGHKVKTGKGYVNKPASGLPAMGAGWGGPANGEGTQTPINEHPANAALLGPGELTERRRTNEEIRLRALAKIDALIDSPQEGIALSAANAALDRVEGKAIQRLASTPNGETVEELRTIDASQLTIEQRDALRAAILAEKERRG